MTWSPAADGASSDGSRSTIAPGDRPPAARPGHDREAPAATITRSSSPCPWIEAWPEPALVVAADLQVLDANAAFHANRAYAAELPLVAGRLRPHRALAGRLVAALVEAATAHGERVLPCAGSDRLLELRLTPVPPGCGVEGAVVLTLHDAAAARRVCARRLRALYGLTPMQAEVASRLVESLDAAAVAAALGVSLNTVRTHLRVAIRKTGTTSQVELVQRLALGAARTRPSSHHPMP